MVGPLSPSDSAHLTSSLSVVYKLIVRFSARSDGQAPVLSSLPVATKPRMMLVPSIEGDDVHELLAVREQSTNELSVFDLIVVGSRFGKSQSDSMLTYADVVALVTTTGNVHSLAGKAAVDYIWDSLDRQNSALYAKKYNDFATVIGKPFADLTAAVLSEQIVGLQETRAEYATYLVHSRQIDTEPSSSNQQVQGMLQTLEGLSISILIGQIRVLSDTNELLAQNRQDQADAVEARDRFIAQWGLVLILPALLFSFLGINVIPSQLFGQPTASLIYTTAAALGGVAISTFGYLVIRLRSKKVKETDAKH
jgi:hypothetical protein